MEEYNAWILLKDKWPFLVVIVVVLVSLFTITEISRRKEKNRKENG